ncbi:hypothetical protein E4U41_004779, partial [Claviceps citrina]
MASPPPREAANPDPIPPRATPAPAPAPALTEKTIHHIPPILPHEGVFPIQIGGHLFRLSGASLSSDAPSYFSQYFVCQMEEQQQQQQQRGRRRQVVEDAAGAAGAVRTLYIDRDPETFRDIALHLQGYRVRPRDGTHF